MVSDLAVAGDTGRHKRLPFGGASFKTVTLASAITLTIFVIDILLPLGVAAGVPYVALVLMGVWFPHHQHTYVLAVLGSVLVIVGYFLSPNAGILWVVLTNRGLALFAIWITAALIASRKRFEIALRLAHEGLEQRVEERTLELSREVIERKRAEEQANIASRAKSELLANMSHELRTPLNAIIGFSESMKKEMFGPVGGAKNREYLNDIHHSGHHLLGIINDILDVSAIEAGAVKLREENINLAHLVDASARLVRARADNGQVSITASIDTEIPLIYVDQQRVKQVLLNLLSNAVKFTPKGGKVTVGAQLNEDGSLAVDVTDTGIGMDEEEVAVALNMFGQVDSGFDREHQGTGLGLPLTKGLMDLHGGTMKIKSKKGHGTSVTLTFPKERVI